MKDQWDRMERKLDILIEHRTDDVQRITKVEADNKNNKWHIHVIWGILIVSTIGAVVKAALPM